MADLFPVGMGKNYDCMAWGPFTNNILVKLPRIFPEAPLKLNGAPGDIQDNLTSTDKRLAK